MPAIAKVATIAGSFATLSAAALYSSKQKNDFSAQAQGYESQPSGIRLQKPKLPSEFLHLKIGGYEFSNA